MSRDGAQLQLERSLSRLIERADGVIACHLMALDDENLRLLMDSKRAGKATVAVWLALSERLGYVIRTMAPEVLKTFVELLETERGMETQRRAGGGGFYAPVLAAAMAGYLRNGREGLERALEQFPVLSDYSRDRFSERLVD